jgi:hypothetical protein
MQLKTIRFKNGDIIACGVDDKLTTETLHDYEFIIIRDPVEFGTFRYLNQQGQIVETISMAPFIPSTSDHEILVPTESILTVCNLRPGAKIRYDSYLDVMHKEQAGKLDEPEQSHRIDPALAEEIWDALEEAAVSKLH